MRRLLVTMQYDLPDEATEEEADALATYVGKLASAPSEAAASEQFPLRPVGKLSDWLFEGGEVL
jgi:hypothetical protein